MNNLRKVIILLVGVLLSGAAMAQRAESLCFEKRYTFYFRVNSDELDDDYMGNSETKGLMYKEIGTLLSNPSEVDSIILLSSASPEGRYEINRRLARERSKMASTLVEELFPELDPSKVKIGVVDEDWDGLRKLVEQDTELYARDQILDIFRTSRNNKELKERLMALENGKVFSLLYQKHCDVLRYCVVVVRIVMKVSKPVDAMELVTLTSSVPSISKGLEFTPSRPSFHKHLTLKTNTLGWVLTGSNIAVEIDLAKHLSLAVPFYFSGGLDYFKETIKFRGIVLQPELRYYPKLAADQTNGGFFIGAHVGLGWYNFALNGDYRIQDHAGKRPAYGGGLGLGYSLQFKKNSRWGMEFAIGAGVYDVLYDTFYNEANGPYNEKAVSDIWIGIDNASVSFTYDFDLRKGGKK